jgi:alpha-L-rhamnosidase
MKKTILFALLLLCQTRLVQAQSLLNNARWIGAITDAEANVPRERTFSNNRISKADSIRWANTHPLSKQSIRVRKLLTLNKPLRSATCQITGLGLYELYIDGQKQGRGLLQPAWSDYDKRVYVDTYDLTKALAKPTAEVEIWLGNGFYNIQTGRYNKLWVSFGPPKTIANIRLTYTDGSVQDVPTDASWQYAPTPIPYNCIMGGEDYDARQEKTINWLAVKQVEAPKGQLTPTVSPPIVEKMRLQTARITNPKPGVYVYDMGQNFAGYPALTVHGKAGQTIRITPAELLHPDGTVNQISASGGWPGYQLRYTLKGGAPETWHPHFTYFGSRYWQVQGGSPATVPATADEAVIDRMEGVVVHNDSPEVGRFACSDTLFNAIHRLIGWAFRSNMMHVMTDCPHREKLGWMEQNYLNGPALFYNFDASRLYGKILNDMQDAQRPNGLVPDIAPEYTVFGGGFVDSPEWGSSYLFSGWLLYQKTGNKAYIAQHYETMKRYVTYLTSKSQNHLLAYGLGDWYDIGPGNPGESKLTSRGVTATLTYFRAVEILGKMAALLGKPDEARQHAALAEQIKTAYNASFFNAEKGFYDRNSQAANAMSLVCGVVPPDQRTRVLDNLVADIRAKNNHVTAGDIGHWYLIQALQNSGRSDVLFDMISRTDPPSYGAQVRSGATALTEAWDGNPYSSQNHFMLGQIDEWFYQCVAGLGFDPAVPGQKRVVFRPELGTLTWAEATYQAPEGQIRSRWDRTGNKLTYRVSVPKGLTAEAYVPGSTNAPIRLNGKAQVRSRHENGRYVLALAAGEYVVETLLEAAP